MTFWYYTRLTLLSRLLLPLSWLTAVVTRRRYRHRRPGNYTTPVLVVGNLSVGGTGKSPTIQALVCDLTARGFCCGIVSRGYGGRSSHYPLAITQTTPAAQCGDEPKLLAGQLGCPVVVDPDRHRAVTYLLKEHRLDVVISDDGLQHYQMGRDFELVMIDGVRGLGNRQLLPAGPLREEVSRLADADWRVAKGSAPSNVPVDAVLTLNPQWPVNESGQRLESGTDIRAYAGIGHPQAFFQQVSDLGFRVVETGSAGDHQPVPDAWLRDSRYPLVITEKDAVKLSSPWPSHCFVIRLRPELPEKLLDSIETALRSHLAWQQ